jgi:poly-gamma-glutamate capsule biosynthesis protein CapA/YwtB (metallophosphatase superfamily)
VLVFPQTPKRFNFRMHPAGLDVLKVADITCVNLANNHVLDFGRRGLLDTLDYLHAEHIATCGAGIHAAAAMAPAIQPLPGGRRMVVFGLACLDAGCQPSDQALHYRPGIQLLAELHANSERAKVSDAISRVCAIIDRYRQPDDFIALSIHWGGNWPKGIPASYRSFAHHCIDHLGVNLIHGHSAHGPMEIERHGSGLILYGCGDVFNDYEGRPDLRELRVNKGMLYILDINHSTHRIETCHYLPIIRQGFCLSFDPIA